MTGIPTVFVDFHRRHPTVPNRFATYLHELPEAALGMKVHVTDYDEFDLSGEIVAINRDANELIIDVEFTSGQAGPRRSALEAYDRAHALPSDLTVHDLHVRETA